MATAYTTQRSPTLKTILMIEHTLQRQDTLISIGQLKRITPKQIMHQPLMAILDYLEYSGKITRQHDKILWTYAPQSKLKNKLSLKVR